MLGEQKMRRCRTAKGRFRRCGGRRASGRHCRFGVNKITKRCLKHRRSR